MQNLTPKKNARTITHRGSMVMVLILPTWHENHKKNQPCHVDKIYHDHGSYGLGFRPHRNNVSLNFVPPSYQCLEKHLQTYFLQVILGDFPFGDLSFGVRIEWHTPINKVSCILVYFPINFRFICLSHVQFNTYHVPSIQSNTLQKFNSSPLKIIHPTRKGSSSNSNHPFFKELW